MFKESQTPSRGQEPTKKIPLFASESVTDEEVEDLFKSATAEGMEQRAAKDTDRVANMKLEEARQEAARLRAQDHRDSAALVGSIRAKMGLAEAVPLEKVKKQKLAVTAEEMKDLQLYGEVADTKNLGLGESTVTYGGALGEAPKLGTTGKSEATFAGQGKSEEAIPAMFSLKDMEAAEKKRQAGTRPPASGASANP